MRAFVLTAALTAANLFCFGCLFSVSAQQKEVEYGVTLPVSISLPPSAHTQGSQATIKQLIPEENRILYQGAPEVYTQSYYSEEAYTALAQWFKAELPKEGWTDCADFHLYNPSERIEYLTTFSKPADEAGQYWSITVNNTDQQMHDIPGVPGKTYGFINLSKIEIPCLRDMPRNQSITFVDDYKATPTASPNLAPLYSPHRDSEHDRMNPEKIELLGSLDQEYYEGAKEGIYGLYWSADSPDQILNWYTEQLLNSNWQHCAEFKDHSLSDELITTRVFKKQAAENYQTLWISTYSVHPKRVEQYAFGPNAFEYFFYLSQDNCGHFSTRSTSLESNSSFPLSQLSQRPGSYSIALIVIAACVIILFVIRRIWKLHTSRR